MKTIDLKDRRYLEKLVKKYSSEETSKLEQLRELDKKARRVAIIFAYVFGTIGALVLGIGMCIAMEVILVDFNLMHLGILIGCLGILMVSINYFIYIKLLKKGKAKYSKQVIELSDELLNE